MLPITSKRVCMARFIFRERRVQGTWLYGSKSCYFFSRKEIVLFIGGKKSKRSKIGAIFKKIWKVILMLVNMILALDTLRDFASFIKTYLGW